MKKKWFYKMIAMACMLMVSAAAYADNDKPIRFEELPKAAQDIISRNFANKKIAMMTMEKGLLDREYNVVFADGDELEFDRKGQWTSIDCKRKPVPAAFIPVQITAYLNSTYNGEQIKKIEKDNKEYEVELTNGTEITFNKSFQVVDIDD